MSLKRRKHSRGPGSRKHNAKLRLGGILIGGLCFSGLALLSLFGYFYSFLRLRLMRKDPSVQALGALVRKAILESPGQDLHQTTVG